MFSKTYLTIILRNAQIRLALMLSRWIASVANVLPHGTVRRSFSNLQSRINRWGIMASCANLQRMIQTEQE